MPRHQCRRRRRPRAHDRVFIERLERRQLLTLVGDQHIGDLFNANGTLLYVNDDGIHGQEIWRSDGTQAGTYLLKDINPGPSGSRVDDRYLPSAATRQTFFEWNNATYFSADDRVDGAALWKTNGTSARTVKVSDFAASGIVDPHEFAPFNGTLFVAASGGLWKTDGTSAGTGQVQGFPDDQIYDLTVAENSLFFLKASFSGPTLWRTDGTSTGTTQVAFTFPSGLGLKDISLHSIGGHLLIVDPGTDSSESSASGKIWTLNAATGALVPLYQSSLRVTPVADFLGRLLFIEHQAYAIDADPAELWATDGTVAGTVSLWKGSVIDWNYADAPSRIFHRVGAAVYFDPREGLYDPLQLWRTDGTPNGTKLLDADAFRATSLTEHLREFVDLDRFTYFIDGSALCKSDGAPLGTAFLNNSPKLAGFFSEPWQSMAVVGNRIFMLAADQLRGAELWSYEPGSNTFRRLPSVAPLVTSHRGILTIDGSTFDDTLRVSANPNAMTFTLYWNDTPSRTFNRADYSGILIRGNIGNDTITVQGFLPRVTIFGGTGSDTINGSDADDSIFGGDGGTEPSAGRYTFDSINGGGGNDTLSGGANQNTIVGGAGNDLILGNSGHDELYGGSGSDTLRGGGGSDYLEGDDGNDFLYGDAGDDQLVAGSVVPDGDDVFSGGDGNDVVDYSSRSQNLIIALDGRAHDGAAGERDNVLADVEGVHGGAGDDLIVGSPMNNYLWGEGGNDTLLGMLGDDSIFGGDGNDSLNGDVGNDTLTGGMGNDTLDAGNGNDLLIANDDNGARDYLYGGKGIDAAKVDDRDRRSYIEQLLA